MKNRTLPMNLQLFAEPADPPTEPTDPVDPPAPKDDPPTDPPKDPKKEKKYSDDDVDNILNTKFVKWKKDQEEKVKQAEKLAKMTEQQKAEHQRDELQKKLDALMEKEALNDMSKTARGILKDDHGIDIPDELLSRLVSADAEETKAAVDSFASIFKDVVDTAVKKALKGEPPKGGKGGSATLTREQITQIKDPVERQRLIQENMHLFE